MTPSGGSAPDSAVALFLTWAHRTGRLTVTPEMYAAADKWAALSGPPPGSPPDAFARLALLPADWDSYGAPPISQQSIDRARAWLDSVQVVPTSHGGVQLEWHRDYWDVEVEFDAEGKLEVHTAALRGAAPPTLEGPTDVMDLTRVARGLSAAQAVALARWFDARTAALRGALEMAHNHVKYGDPFDAAMCEAALGGRGR